VRKKKEVKRKTQASSGGFIFLVLETGFGGCVIQTIPLGLLNSYRL
jgi:hypothetical protein